MRPTIFQVKPKRGKNMHTLSASVEKMHLRKQLRKGFLWVAGLLVTMGVVGGLTHWTVQAVMRKVVFDNPKFRLEQIDVDVRGGLPQRDVIRAARLEKGQNLMRIDLRQVKADIEKLPYVAEAQVSRHLPNRILIRVSERIPIARFSTTGKMREVFYIDREGVLMKARSMESAGILPEITGCHWQDPEPGQPVELPEVKAAIQLLKIMERTPLRGTLQVKTLDISNMLYLRMIAADGMQVQFRRDVLDQQLQRLYEILEFSRLKQNPVATVDLTIDRNVPVTFVN